MEMRSAHRMDNRDELLRLIDAKLQAGKAEHMAQLNRELFRDMVGAPLMPPVSWWTRWIRGTRAYLSTLWLALKGHDFTDWDDY